MAKSTKPETTAGPPPAPEAWKPKPGDRVSMRNGGGTYTVAEPKEGGRDDEVSIVVDKNGYTNLIKISKIEPAPDPSEPEAPAPAKPAAKGPPVEMTDADELAAWRADARAAAAKVAKLHAKYLASKDVAASDKKAWESAAEELQEFILEEPEEMPLFDGKAKPAASAPAPVADGDDAAGLAERVKVLAVAGKYVSALEDGGLKTIGDVAAYTAKGRKLADLPGIGKAGEDVISAALAGFWDKRRTDAIPRPEAAKAPTDPAVVRDVFSALVSVGYSESSARAAIDGVTATGRSYARVADMIDAIYAAKDALPDVPPKKPKPAESKPAPRPTP